MAMQDPLDGVATFVQVVEAGGFAAAAQRLGLTRSAVGKTIARLEARVGTRLLQRNTRNQVLTEEGQAYYERCLRALAEMDAAQADLDQGRSMPSGRLRVSVPEAFGQLCVAPILLALTQQYPQMQVDMSFTDRQVDVLEEGFDLAVRIGALADSSTLAARRLGRQEMGLGAAPAYLARMGAPKVLEDLRKHVAIAYSVMGVALRWEPKGYEPASQISMDDIQAIAAAAVAGYGLAWLPGWLLDRYVRSGQLQRVLPEYRVQGYDIHAVWPQSRQLRCKVRVAIDALVRDIPQVLKPGRSELG